MMIRSAAALRNDYDGMVKLSTEKQEPIYLTRNGDGKWCSCQSSFGKNVRQNWSSLRKCCAGSKINSPAQEHIPQANCVPTWRTFFARVEWLNKVHEFLAFLKYYKTEVGAPYAKKFADKVLHATQQLAEFLELGVLKYDMLMGKHGFRALFIGQYVCIYKIAMDTVYIYHFANARKNYMYHIFGME